MAAWAETKFPVYLRVGQGAEHNIGWIFISAVVDKAGTLAPAAPDIAAFLREAADTYEQMQASDP